MVELRKHFMDLGRIRLHAREAGTGRPIVLLHGITANNAVWDPVAQALAADGRVVSVSQRGHGLSDAPDPETHGYGGIDYADDLIALAEHLGGDVVVVGHSLGSRNALVAGALRPDLFAAVVGVDFTPFIEPEVFDQLSSRVAGGDQVFADVQAVEQYLSNRYRKMPKDAVRRRAEHGYRSTDAGLVPLADSRALAKTAEGLREPLEDAVSAITVPTVLVRGEGSALVSRAAFERTTALRPDLDYTVVPGADHYVPEEQPEAVVAITRMMLKRRGS